MSTKIKDSIDNFHSSSIYLPTRSIRLSGEVDDDMLDTALKNLHALDSTNGTINIFLTTEGGDVDAGLAIYDAIKGCVNYVRVMVYGECSSAGTIIFQAGDERLMSPHSYLMVHIGTEGTSGHPENKARWDEWYKKQEIMMENIYLAQIKKKKKRYSRNMLKSMLRFDTILTPKEAIEVGLADMVCDQFKVNK